jgi:hypothetical protein
MKIVLTESQLKVLVEKYKIADQERIKLFDTDDFLLVVPLTHTASCKYGANTKWCVTEKDDDDMFKRHYKLAGLGFLIVKNPEMQEKLGNDKFAFYINKPKTASAARNPERVIVYDDLGDIIPIHLFLNMADSAGAYEEVKNALSKFMLYTIDKFSSESFPKISK